MLTSGNNSNNLRASYADLRSCLCTLAMSLYIDHEPLHRVILPNFCRLFKTCGQYLVQSDVTAVTLREQEGGLLA